MAYWTMVALALFNTWLGYYTDKPILFGLAVLFGALTALTAWFHVQTIKKASHFSRTLRGQIIHQSDVLTYVVVAFLFVLSCITWSHEFHFAFLF